jgi:hypothetical protein
VTLRLLRIGTAAILLVTLALESHAQTVTLQIKPKVGDTLRLRIEGKGSRRGHDDDAPLIDAPLVAHDRRGDG